MVGDEKEGIAFVATGGEGAGVVSSPPHEESVINDVAMANDKEVLLSVLYSCTMPPEKVRSLLVGQIWTFMQQI